MSARKLLSCIVLSKFYPCCLSVCVLPGKYEVGGHSCVVFTIIAVVPTPEMYSVIPTVEIRGMIVVDIENCPRFLVAWFADHTTNTHIQLSQFSNQRLLCVWNHPTICLFFYQAIVLCNWTGVMQTLKKTITPKVWHAVLMIKSLNLKVAVLYSLWRDSYCSEAPQHVGLICSRLLISLYGLLSTQQPAIWADGQSTQACEVVLI